MAYYDINGRELERVYRFDGSVIDSDKVLYRVAIPTILMRTNGFYSGSQGFCIDDVGRIIQLYLLRMRYVNVNTGFISDNISSNFGHGSGVQFRKDNGKSYLYVSTFNVKEDTDGWWNELGVYEITDTTCNKIKSYVVKTPIEPLGAMFAIDFDNNVAWFHWSDSWNASEVTHFEKYTISDADKVNAGIGVSGNTYVLEKLGSFDIPFVTNNQASTFRNGKVVMLSDGLNKQIVFIDPIKQKIVEVWNYNLDGENEGLDFDTSGNLIVSKRGDDTYYKLVI